MIDFKFRIIIKQRNSRSHQYFWNRSIYFSAISKIFWIEDYWFKLLVRDKLLEWFFIFCVNICVVSINWTSTNGLNSNPLRRYWTTLQTLIHSQISSRPAQKIFSHTSQFTLTHVLTQYNDNQFFSKFLEISTQTPGLISNFSDLGLGGLTLMLKSSNME